MKLLTIMLIGVMALGCTAQAKTIEVKILKRKFIPATLTVQVGDTVVWQNVEKRQYHNVWFKAQVKEEPGYFFPGESYSRTFNDAGTFNYECGPHPDMKGVVKVVSK